MALVSTPSLVWPPQFVMNAAGGFGTTVCVINSTTNTKTAVIGKVYWPDYTGSGTKNIDKIALRFGAVTKAGGSGCTLSLQDVDTVNGPPYRPDGVQDQSIAIPNATLAANADYLSGSLSSQRTVAYGEQIAVVLEWDGTGVLGADSVALASIATKVSTISGTVNLISGTWTNVGSADSWSIGFEFSDGSIGGLRSGMSFINMSNTTINNTTTPDEVGIKLTMPFKCVVDGFTFEANNTVAGATYDLRLEDSGGTLLASVSQDAIQIAQINSNLNGNRWSLASPVTLNAGDVVYLSLRPTSANSIRYIFVDTRTAPYWAAAGWWPATGYTTVTRKSGGAWTETTTRRVIGGLLISQIDDGTGSGTGNGPIHARMHM